MFIHIYIVRTVRGLCARACVCERQCNLHFKDGKYFSFRIRTYTHTTDYERAKRRGYEIINDRRRRKIYISPLNYCFSTINARAY
jgi:hypothetical protein